MTAETAFSRAVKLIVGAMLEPIVIVGKATNIDRDENTCDIERDDRPIIYSVRLNAEKSDNGLRVFPADGSEVIALALDANSMEYVVVMTSEVDEVWLGGSANGGLVKVDDLTTKLNALQSKVNSLVQAFNAHTHTVATTGTAAAQSGTAAAPATQAQQADEFDSTDYTNDKVKH